jgi:hypothetical protein
MNELYFLLQKFNKDQRYMKASRHLKDAMYLRGIRNDVDSKIQKLYNL